MKNLLLIAIFFSLSTMAQTNLENINFYNDTIKAMDAGNFEKFKKLVQENKEAFFVVKNQLLKDAQVRYEATLDLAKTITQEKPVTFFNLRNLQTSIEVCNKTAKFCFGTGTTFSLILLVDWIYKEIKNIRINNLNTARLNSYNASVNASNTNSIPHLLQFVPQQPSVQQDPAFILIPFITGLAGGFLCMLLEKVCIEDLKKSPKDLDNFIIAYVGHMKIVNKKLNNLSKIQNYILDQPA